MTKTIILEFDRKTHTICRVGIKRTFKDDPQLWHIKFYTHTHASRKRVDSLFARLGYSHFIGDDIRWIYSHSVVTE